MVNDGAKSENGKDNVESVEKLPEKLRSSLSESLFQNGILSANKRGKSVSFADSRGLKLEEIREFDGSTDFAIPRSFSSMTSQEAPRPAAEVSRYFLLFPQPSVNQRNFTRSLWSQKVCLHLAWVRSQHVIATVHVINLDYVKHVDARVTFDSWRTFQHFPAKFSRSESDDVDVFDLDFVIPRHCRKANFCVRYRCKGATYWDNNRGLDYCVAGHMTMAGEDLAGDSAAFVT